MPATDCPSCREIQRDCADLGETNCPECGRVHFPGTTPAPTETEYPASPEGFEAMLTDSLSHQQYTSDIHLVVPFTASAEFLGEEVPGYGVVIQLVDGREYRLEFSLERVREVLS